jgi:hypothetical protein
MQLH